jgi:crotonobetainyl-CoA:carnitine CoA-transferase CaiB-like acyl-CoA transferase
MHVGISYGDPTAGLHGAVAVLAALLHRQRTGEGQFIDLSQMESMIALLPEGVMDFAMNRTQPPRRGNRDPHMAPHGVFRCRGDQRWVAIAVRDEPEWKRFAQAISMPALGDEMRFHDLRSRKANEGALEEIITTWTTERSDTEVVQLLQSYGIPAASTFNSRDLAEDPHLQQLGLFVELEHPEVGRQMHIGMPWRMSGTPTKVEKAAPCLGEDTDSVMQLLGYSKEEVAELRKALVLY